MRATDARLGQQVAIGGDGPFTVIGVGQRRIRVEGFFGTENEPGGLARWTVEGELLDRVEPWDPEVHPIEWSPWGTDDPRRHWDHVHYDPGRPITWEELEGPQSRRARLWGRIRRWWYRSGPWWSWTPPWRSS